jgi:hypothetical protein
MHGVPEQAERHADKMLELRRQRFAR